MDRVHYRRTTPSRYGNERSGERNGNGYYNHHNNETITKGETIIMQCIVSGVILVAVLLIGLLDTAPTATLRNGIRDALTGATTVNELTTDIRIFGEEWLGWEAVTPAPYIPIIPLPEATYIPATPITIEEMLELPPLTAYDEVSNPQIPGPSATPGLWD